MAPTGRWRPTPPRKAVKRTGAPTSRFIPTRLPNSERPPTVRNSTRGLAEDAYPAGHRELGPGGAGLVPAHPVGSPAAVFAPEAGRSGAGLRAALDGVRSAGQRFQELVAHPPGLLLVPPGGYPAGRADGQLPLAAQYGHPRGRADAFHAHHGLSTGLH